MKIPTLKHLGTIAADLAACVVVWDPYGRKPWRLATADNDWVRGPAGEITPRYPEGMPGRVYEFPTGNAAATFLRDSLGKLGEKP